MSEREPGAAFDAFAERYDEALARGLSLSGERRDFFARGRVAHLVRCLDRLGARPRRALDFGCGNGDTVRLLAETFGLEFVLGLDESEAMVQQAAARFGSDRLRFSRAADHAAAAGFDLVYLNGVIHHVPPAARAALMARLAEELRPGGLLSLWENNPWNPGARWVMRRIPFDRDAVLIGALEARRLVRAAGLEVVRTDFLFIFPSALSVLRPLERALTRLPLGAQYQLLCRRPRPMVAAKAVPGSNAARPRT